MTDESIPDSKPATRLNPSFLLRSSASLTALLFSLMATACLGGVEIDSSRGDPDGGLLADDDATDDDATDDDATDDDATDDDAADDDATDDDATDDDVTDDDATDDDATDDDAADDDAADDDTTDDDATDDDATDDDVEPPTLLDIIRNAAGTLLDDERFDVVSETAPETDEDYICTVAVVDEAMRISRFFESTSEAVWPGALLVGAELEAQRYTPIALPRGPMTISVSGGENFAVVSKEVDSPTTSSVREAISDILVSHYADTTSPADFSFEVESVTSEKKLSIALQAAGGNLVTEVSGGFSSESTDIRSRLVARFRQQYFTIDADTPTSPDAVFGEDVTAEDLATVIGPGNPAVYISSVSYGRVAYFIIESSFSSTEVEAALKATHEGAVYNAQVESAFSIGQILDQSSMKVVIYGGAADTGISAINGYQEFQDYIQTGANFSASSPAKPIAFTARYLHDNSEVSLAVAAEYEERSCQRWNQSFRVQLVNISIAGSDGGNGLEVFGNLGRVYRNPSQHSGDYFTFANRASENSYIHIPANSHTDVASLGLSKDVAFDVNTYDSIELYADVYESDTSPDADDHYGSGTTPKLIYPDDFNRDISLAVKSGSDTVRLDYRISPL